MSEMKYCQGPKCHEHKTKDRIRGPKGAKQYETRKRTNYYDLFCDQRCMYEWIELHGQHAVDHFGRIHEPKSVMADNAWYKDYRYNGYDHTNARSNNTHYFVNDLLGQRIRITEQQYDDDNFTHPN